MEPQAGTAESAELAGLSDDFDFSLRQALFYAATRGMLYDAVAVLMANAAEGLSPTEAVEQLVEAFDLPRPVRIH